jgi:hypothetical protein
MASLMRSTVGIPAQNVSAEQLIQVRLAGRLCLRARREVRR